ncbi:hypothetical protein Q0M94_16880 (plasmid) [Deinococcus radiomollis]|uniref:hypothetical protein n=1 Tax=Deinococcus radiomollis TaxID=468916 RepID=UPI0038924541
MDRFQPTYNFFMTSARNIALLAFSLALTACNTAQHPTDQPSGRNILGVYEIGFRGNALISSQALSNTNQPLSFQRLSVTTIDDSRTGRQYVHPLYRVTNTSSVPLTNLTFLPTNLAKDPSTTASVLPTIGTTEFKQISYFDGSDASASAASLRAEQARVQVTQGVSTPIMNVDTSATVFRANLDLQGLIPTAPQGLIATVKPYGWLFSGTLQPGASTTLDLGASVPLSTRNPYFYNVVLTVAEDSRSFTPTLVASTVRDQVGNDPTNTLQPWSGGAASLEFFGGEQNNDNHYKLATGSVDTTGNLSLELASEREMTGMGRSYIGSPAQNQPNCTTTVTASDNSLNTLDFNSLQAKTATGTIRILPGANFNSATRQYTGGVYLYADRPAVLNGSLTCSVVSRTFNNVTLRKGWNMLREDGVGPVSTISNGIFPSGWLNIR